MTETESPSMDIYQRRQRLFGILAIITAVILLLLSLLPLAIRIGATSWLEDHGAEQVEIANVDLNLFKGSFAIEGLSAGAGLKVGRLALNIDWWPMLNRHVYIHSFEIKNTELEVHQREDGSWQLSTIQLDDTPAETEKPEAGSDQPWQIVLNSLDVAEVNLKAGGKIGDEAFDLSLPLKSLNIALENAEEGGAQLLKNAIELGKVTFNGLGYAVENSSFQMSNRLFLPAMGTDIAAGLKLDDLTLKLNGLSVEDMHSGVQLLGVGLIQLDRARLAGAEKAAFELLSIQSVSLPSADQDSLGKIGKIEMHQADLDFSGTYSLKQVAIDDIQASLKKSKLGKLLVLDELQTAAKADGASEAVQKGDADSTQAAEAESQTVIHIGELLVSAGSAFSYSDESLLPPFNTKVEVQQFRFAPIDLSGKESGKLDVLLKLDKNGSLSINGDISPNSDDLRSDLNIVLKNFNMPGLTGFVEGDFGQSIKTGQMDLNTEIKIASNKIDASNKLVIRRLALEKGKKPGKAEQSLGMPIDMALDMLRDDRGDISIDVPITGQLDDPNINVKDVINQALVSSISGGVMTYAKLLLQPYGAIYMAAEYAAGAASKASKPKLTPIQFAARSPLLTPEMSDYAGKIATLLKGKAFRLEICGIATRLEGAPVSKRDKPMTDEQLLSLAEARSDAVLKMIQEQGIDAGRLFHCRPAIDEKPKDASPRVKLLLD